MDKLWFVQILDKDGKHVLQGYSYLIRSPTADAAKAALYQDIPNAIKYKLDVREVKFNKYGVFSI